MLRSILLACTLAFSAVSANAYTTEQVWEAEIRNNQRVCGIEFDGGKKVGGILLKNEQGTNTEKAITFKVKSNVQDTYWKITEAKIIDNALEYSFEPNLMTQVTKENTSIFVNDREYAWKDTNVEQYLQKKDRQIKIAPKINMDLADLPYGTTRIQGKIVIVCSDSQYA